MRELFSRATNHADQRLADSALRPRPVPPLHSFSFSREDFFKIVWGGTGCEGYYIIWQFGIIHNGILSCKHMPRAIYQDDHKKIVARLKSARLEAGLGQIEVAEKLGRTQSYVSKIESGQRRFDVLQLKEFAKLYKKSLDFFLS